MTSLKEKVLEYYEKGLKAKEISETLDEPYEIVSRIIKTKQNVDHKARNSEKVKIQQKNSYIKNRPKNKILWATRYQKNKDEISMKTKEDRKINPEKYRLKRQKEKAKDPVRYNRRKKRKLGKKLCNPYT